MGFWKYAKALASKEMNGTVHISQSWCVKLHAHSLKQQCISLHSEGILVRARNIVWVKNEIFKAQFQYKGELWNTQFI